MWLRILLAVLAAIVSSEAGANKSDYLEHLINGMFPEDDSATETDLPDITGCRLVLSRQDDFSVFGDSCLSVPGGVALNSTGLSVTNTRIAALTRRDFHNWPNLRSLSIEMNDDLRKIEPGAFEKLAMLRNLSICNNYNLELEAGVFKGLGNLRELRLVKNGIVSVKSLAFSLSPAHLPSLLLLDLSDNSLGAINNTDFEPMRGTAVRKLFFNLCNLFYVGRNALSPFGELRHLSLARNNLNITVITNLVIGLNETAPHLKFLNLDANLMHKKPYDVLKVIADTPISELELRENHFDPLVPGFFPVMPHLRSLDLSGIMASEIGDNTLNLTVMPALRKLILSKNRFTGVSPSFIIPTLTYLDLSQNTADPYTSLFKLSENQFVNMTALSVLNLSKNSLFHIKIDMFAGLINLTVLLLQNCSIYRLDHYAFQDMRSLEYLDMSHNFFTSYHQLTGSMFVGLNKLIGLKMDYCSLNSFTDPHVFANLPELQYLTLRGNALVEFEANIFSPMPNVVKVDMSENDLLRWNKSLFHNNPTLKYLYVVSNQISKVSFEMLYDFSRLDYLDLKDNPLECNCQMVLEVVNYLRSGNYTVDSLHLADTPNYCFSPRSYSNVLVKDYVMSHMNGTVCESETIVIVCIGIAAAMLVSTVLMGIVYYLRWHIRYWMFLLRQSFGHNRFPGRADRGPEGRYKYDAFVSYSNEDRNFVVRLAAMLEKQPPYINLCVFERDFNIGDVISETVMTSVEASRRTLIVLTDAFARSQWCLWEMYIAQHKRIFFRGAASDPDPLVIIKLGDVAESHMTPTLRYLMKTRIYLEWHKDAKKQKVFWQKLREALAADRKKMDSKGISGHSQA